MGDLTKGKTLLLTATRTIEELAVGNEALWHILRVAWPYYLRDTKCVILEQAVETAKDDPQVTGRLRQSFHEFRKRVKADVEQAEALEWLKQFPPTGKPN
jgi:hypothetical protein